MAEKSQTIENELSRLINEAQNLSDYGTLEAKIKDIDKYQGETSYESRRTEINQLKSNLINLDENKFKQGSQKRIENLIQNNEVKKDDLNEETQKALVELKNEKDVDKINELENKVSEGVNEQKAKNTLKQLLQKVREVINDGARATVEQVQKIKKDFYSFYHSNNKYNSLVIESEKDEVRNAMQKLENYNYSNNVQPPKPGFFRPSVIIPLALVTVIGLGVLVAIARKRKMNKRKI